MALKAVEMTRTIRDRHYDETRNMTREEYVAYLQAKSELLANSEKTPAAKAVKSSKRHETPQKRV